MNGGGAVSLLAIKVATRLHAIELKVDQFDFRLNVSYHSAHTASNHTLLYVCCGGK
jgi:hypothetical protein